MGVLGYGLRFCPSIPGFGLWCLRLGLGLVLHHTILGWSFGACVVVCRLHLYAAVPGSRVRCACVCLGSGFGCTPPLLAEVFGCVCVCVRVPCGFLPLLAGGAVRVGMLGLALQPRPATPGGGVWACVCLCARPACTPLLLPGVCLVGVCAWVLVSAVPRHSWLRRWGVCVFVRVPRLYPAIPGGGGACVCWFWFLLLSGMFLAWLLGRVASCVRRVRFPSPSGGASCGVGMCGSCRGLGLSSPLPFRFFFFGLRGGFSFRPCRVVALWCLSLALLVLGLVVFAPPSPLVQAVPFLVSFARLRPCEVCVGVSGVSSLPMGRWSRLGVAGFGWMVPRCSFVRSRLRCRMALGFARLLWCGWAVSWLWAYFVPPPFFLGGGLPVPCSALPGLLHALVGIRCG